MPLSNAYLYRCHVENLRAVNTGTEHVARQLRAALSTSQNVAAQAFLRIYMLLVGASAESRLNKLLYEDGGFSDQERSLILAKRQKIQQWQEAVEVGFKRRYAVEDLMLLLPEQMARLNTIEMLIQTDLKPIIEIRNRLAHGQWTKTFNSDGTDISPAHMNALVSENSLSAQLKMKMIEGLADLVHDLVSTRFAFERDFDSHFKRVTTLRSQLRNKSYGRYLSSLLEKEKRGAKLRVQSYSKLSDGRNSGATADG